ncbi:MAG: hypothetical protein JSW28_05275 [Thermoplasmata archaeon]|nr:MAG: hypothetical protein JSW28_05275 [Thermoplasmata archaeon]
MGKGIFILVLATALTVICGAASAGVPEVYANDIFHAEPGVVFELLIFVECHADASNYTVTVNLHPRFVFAEEGSDMTVSDRNASITYLGYDADTLRFEFPMAAENNTPDGKYLTTYSVHWNGSETGFTPQLAESGHVSISVGEGTSGSCTTLGFVVLPLLALVTSFMIVKRYER